MESAVKSATAFFVRLKAESCEAYQPTRFLDLLQSSTPSITYQHCQRDHDPVHPTATAHMDRCHSQYSGVGFAAMLSASTFAAGLWRQVLLFDLLSSLSMHHESFWLVMYNGTRMLWNEVDSVSMLTRLVPRQAPAIAYPQAPVEHNVEAK